MVGTRGGFYKKTVILQAEFYNILKKRYYGEDYRTD